jgi:putative ABC transport system permease protein
MFFTDKPLGTISYEYVEQLEKDNRVNTVVPFTMGDSYNASKIVGTSPTFLAEKELADGEMFNDKFEAVIGYEVANKYGLSIGDKLVTSHGLAEGGHSHEANPLIVVGILDKTKTSYDNVIFTGVETVWATHDHDHEHTDECPEEEHEHHGDVCAILLRCKSPNYVSAIKNEYGKNGELLVINPSEVLREVLDNVDMTTDIVYILCIIILVMNIFIISVITLLNMYDSKKEISLMRLIGISMNKVNMLYIIQNAIIGFASTVLALLCSRLCILMIGGYVASMGIVLDSAKIYPFEFVIMAIVFIISILPTVFCTLKMSRQDGVAE